jgi:ubiquinone/menaquinone biosynthesis C-methylase UbiE
MENARQDNKGELARFYDRTARHYHEMHYIVKTEYTPLKQRQLYIERMIEDLRPPRNAKILDVGCGPGELLLNLLRKGYDARGIDIAEGMVREATATIQASGFPQFDGASVGDIERLQFSNSEFDIVVASGVIEYQKNDDVSLAEMKRVLKPGGHLILNVTNKYSYLTVSDNIFMGLKKLPAVRVAVSRIRGLVAGDSRITDIPNHRVHSPRQFDRKLAEHGFRKVAHNFFRFSPLPVPLNALFSGVCHRVGQRMERFSRTPLGIIGGGYLVLARRTDGAVDSSGTPRRLERVS